MAVPRPRRIVSVLAIVAGAGALIGLAPAASARPLGAPVATHAVTHVGAGTAASGPRLVVDDWWW